MRIPSTPSDAPTTRPTSVKPSDGFSDPKYFESANVGSRNFWIASVVWKGICSAPPMVASTARRLIATFMGISRSAMKWSGPGHRAAEAAHLVDVLGAAHRADHRPGGHEEQRLEVGVRHEVEHAAGVRPGADGHDHVADLRHRRPGDHALDVGHGQADRRGDEQR